MRKTRGSVLVQVLMTAVVVAVIAAGLMNLLLLRATSVKREEQRVSATARTTMGLNNIMAHWAQVGNGVNCTGAPAGFTINNPGSPNLCNCTYTQDATAMVVRAQTVGSSCRLFIDSKPAD